MKLDRLLGAAAHDAMSDKPWRDFLYSDAFAIIVFFSVVIGFASAIIYAVIAI